MMASTNSWLKAQRKSELVELADSVGMTEYDRLKKSELEIALDEFIPRHASSLASRSDLAGYFASRSKALASSPVKRERVDEPLLRVPRSRITRRASAAPPPPPPPPAAAMMIHELSPESPSESGSSSSRSGSLVLATTQTPLRNVELASSVMALPATPADIAQAVDRSTTAVRRRFSTLYRDSGIPLASVTARQALSTVNSILLFVSLVELCTIRPEILPSRQAFVVPAMPALGTDDYPVPLPDMFLLLSSSFWSPAATWALTAFVMPCLAGYVFNLTAAARAAPNVVVDPLVFSIAKALVAKVVYGHRSTLHGLLDPVSIERLDGAVYGGYRGVIVGAVITGLVSMYDAVLRR
ncbi:hypothetical protein L249_6324 [Ophiocordyceps polyrhachis-furcata BCC 54312]|uniref:Rho termination factor N-terminal domain-containing protein n=1 Tax=Ophiocordyceps polyrhachis-furcata BCC 54312 TaxID=1330021 RepID=A0A367L1D4_9HYPO|nr:hypothetical protein L249_6324 [Ophiocordyceps polyrhachis-furcata BCC 54312]